MPPEMDNLEQELDTDVEETTDDSAIEQTEQPVEEEAPAEEGSEEQTEEDDASPGDDESEEGEKTEEGEEEQPAFKPNVKFKAGVYNKETKALEQKEYEIDKRFHSLMKDPESEKVVRELHEKAYGLESIKDRFAETRNFAQSVVAENTEIKKSIDGLRDIYQGAVKSGNYHKLDKFFDKLQIPQDVVLSYALAKVQLNEMDPAQRNAIMGQLDAENRAEEAAQMRADTDAEYARIAQENKQIQLDFTLARPEIAALVAEFDSRMNKPGAFRTAVEQAGQLAWHQSKGRIDLTAEQAISVVIKNYNLTTSPMVPPAKTAVPNQPGAGGANRPVVKRTAGTIPNVQGRNASPLQTKPMNMDQLLKYRKEQHGF